jgi:hypothetical protein
LAGPGKVEKAGIDLTAPWLNRIGLVLGMAGVVILFSGPGPAFQDGD